MSEPSLNDAKAFLEKMREDWRRGWMERGKVTDPNALNAIACLTLAIDNLPHERRKNYSAKSRVR